MQGLEVIPDVDITTTVPPELRSAICPNCGYSREGLKFEDKCPECGREPNPSEIVLYGFSVGASAEPIAGVTPRLRWLAAFFPLWVILSLRELGYFRMWVIILFISVCMYLVRRYDRRHPGLVQVRISPAGVAQFDHSGGATLFAKMRMGYSWLLPVTFALQLIVLIVAQPGVGQLIAFVPMFVIALIFSVSALRVARRFRVAQRNVPENAMADFAAALQGVTPWSRISEYWLQRAEPRRFQLTVAGLGTQIAFKSKGFVIDAVVELDNVRADALHRILSAWIIDARRRQIPQLTNEVERT